MQEICRKESYTTKRRAEKARKHSWLEIYQCPRCRMWHFTHARRTSKEPLPSSAKLKRRLENAGREIAACERRIKSADARLTSENERAQGIAEAAQRDHAETLASINALVDRAMVLAGRA